MRIHKFVYVYIYFEEEKGEQKLPEMSKDAEIVKSPVTPSALSQGTS